MQILFFLSALLIPFKAFAVNLNDYGFYCEPETFVGCYWVGAGGGVIRQLSEYVVFRMVDIIWVVGVIAVCYGAIRIIVSRGNNEQIEHGKKAIFWSIAGIIVMQLVIQILNFVIDFLYYVGT